MSELSTVIQGLEKDGAWLVSHVEEGITVAKSVLALAEGNISTLKDVGILLKAIVPAKDVAAIIAALQMLQKLAADAALADPTNMDIQTISKDLDDCVAALQG